VQQHQYRLENRNYGILIKYPSEWSVQESKSSGELINVATFLSSTGSPYPTAAVAIFMDRLHNSTTNLNSYAHFVAFTDYENRPSYFHAFRLLELNTNSLILAGKPAYTLIGTYQDRGLQKLMEIGTIIGDKAYSIQYIADAAIGLMTLANPGIEGVPLIGSHQNHGAFLLDLGLRMYVGLNQM
jgi:hypothetical protein